MSINEFISFRNFTLMSSLILLFFIHALRNYLYHSLLMMSQKKGNKSYSFARILRRINELISQHRKPISQIISRIFCSGNYFPFFHMSLCVVLCCSPFVYIHSLVRDTISESLSGFPQKSQTPIEALWSLRSIDLRVIALHPSFVKLRMPQNASLVPLISEPIRVNVISFVTYKRGNSQYPEQSQCVTAGKDRESQSHFHVPNIARFCKGSCHRETRKRLSVK